MGRLLPLGEPEAEATPSGLRSPPDFPFGSSTSPSLTLAGQEQRGQLGEGGGHVCDPTVVTGPHPEPWHRGCPWWAPEGARKCARRWRVHGDGEDPAPLLGDNDRSPGPPCSLATPQPLGTKGPGVLCAPAATQHLHPSLPAWLPGDMRGRGEPGARGLLCTTVGPPVPHRGGCHRLVARKHQLGGFGVMRAEPRGDAEATAPSAFSSVPPSPLGPRGGSQRVSNSLIWHLTAPGFL